MPAKEKKTSFVHYLPIYGCFSTGIMYAAIGIIAILSFLRIKRGGADESSLVAFLNDFVIGKILIWIILLGAISYIAWRIYESITDPYNYGKTAKGIVIRTGITLSTIADALIAYTAIQILLGKGNIQENGQPEELRQLVSNLLRENWGKWFIIGMGAIIVVTAIVQLIYGITKGYEERLDMDRYGSGLKSFIHFLAWTGYLARGIILGIMGFFFIKAGITDNAHYVVNTDKAFDFIGDQVGHVYFILVAIGTICYGLFMFVLGAAYDTDKDY
jgi:hypothetical protein